MRVVDSPAWLEWLSGSELGRKNGGSPPPISAWIVPTIVQYELARHAARLSSKQAAQLAMGFSMRCVVLPIDTRLAVRGAEFAAIYALAMADAIIYACAIEAGADLLTRDAHFANLPSVVYVQKTSP